MDETPPTPKGPHYDCQSPGVGGAPSAQLGPWDSRVSILGSCPRLEIQDLSLFDVLLIPQMFAQDPNHVQAPAGTDAASAHSSGCSFRPLYFRERPHPL